MVHTVLRESLGLDRVVTVYVELSRPDWLATVQSGRKQVQSRVCTPSLSIRGISCGVANIRNRFLKFARKAYSYCFRKHRNIFLLMARHL